MTEQEIAELHVNSADEPAGQRSAEGGANHHFMDRAITLARHRVLVLVFPLVAGLIAAIVSLLLPPTYTADTKVVPPQQNQSSGAGLLSQLSPLAMAANGRETL